MNRSFRHAWPLAALLFFGLSSTAWADGGTKVRVGPKLGLGAVSVAYDDETIDEAGKSKFGFSLGGVLDAQLHPSVALQLELLYGLRGGRFENDDIRTISRFHYLYVPVLAAGRFPLSGGTVLKGVGGLYGSYYLSGSVLTEFLNEDLKKLQTEDPEPVKFDRGEIKQFNAGFVLGVGAEFEAAGQQFLAELRWERDFTGHFDRDGSDENAYHSALLLNIGVLFGI